MRGTIRFGLALLLLGAGVQWWRGAPAGARLEPPPAQLSEAFPAPLETVEAPSLSSPAVGSGDQRGCLPAVSALPPGVVRKAPPPPLPLSGRLGLWVAVIDGRTLQPRRALTANPGSVFPLASTYKQAVLWAALREFDAGRLAPTERFDVTRENQSLGSYPYDGTNVRELSRRMIQWSDNTATDILHRRVGLQTVQDVADRLGLCRTRLILPTKTWWVMQSGLSATLNGTTRWPGATGSERARLAALLDADAQAYRPDFLQRKLNDYFDRRYALRDDFLVHNLSTPYEWGTLVAHEFLRPGLSRRARRWQREDMALGFGKAALRAGQAGNITMFGGKGGNGWRLLTYSGYFQTKTGQRVVYAFMQHGADQTYTMPNTRRAFAWINAAVDELIGEQKPEPPPQKEQKFRRQPQETPASGP
ncbi:Beta-lactamase class A [Deinococcus reticulitermitis]|uniref:Beta-lactamase class A n=1 Tax=Deinococcus reticulitermitis TaxID=856736 RepID=A0A1H6WX78_9DEIO|nr:serine hydrolase [Deinococcus reticulitermitis]SEJ21489.1 Beta-lactamase class A [Deinococcus reticulitermitis]